MSDKPSPQKPAPPRYSHLQSEPVPISFASPQQLAQFAAAPPGSLLARPQMKTPYQSHMPMMHSGYNINSTNYQKPPVPSTSTNTTAASSSQPASSTEKILTPLPAQPIDLNTFKSFQFVTLDALQIETRDIYDDISGTFQWEMCESQEERCIDFIQNKCQNARVFLITTGSLGERIVPKVNDLPQVYAIYIYCANVTYHSKWSSKFSKVRVVCDNDDYDLLPRFAVDVAQANIDWGNALLKQGKKDEAKTKFELASDKLKKHACKHDWKYDQSMDIEIKNKLAEC